MLRPILLERFGIETHPETRPASVFDLVVAKGGPKLKQPPPERSGKKEDDRLGDGTVALMTSADSNSVKGYSVDIPGFVVALTGMASRELGRPILDKTGLTGHYDMALRWVPPNNASAAARTDALTEDTGGSLFTAIQEQLGLALKSAKEPQPFLVVDKAHMPTPD